MLIIKSHLHIEISHNPQPASYHLCIKNSKGPKIGPCGTPHSVLAVEYLFLILTQKHLLERYN